MPLIFLLHTKCCHRMSGTRMTFRVYSTAPQNLRFALQRSKVPSYGVIWAAASTFYCLSSVKCDAGTSWLSSPVRQREANRILLASTLSSMCTMCPNRVSRRDWIIAVSLGCFTSLRTSSFQTNWYQQCHKLNPSHRNPLHRNVNNSRTQQTHSLTHCCA